MAILKQSLLESGTGKLGSLVVYNRNGKTCVRSKPAEYHDRRSPAQLAQRQRMMLVKEFLHPFKQLLRRTFASEAISRPAYHSAQSYNMKHGIEGAYPDQRINLQEAMLSRGPIPLPKTIRATLTPKGIQFIWDTYLTGADASGSDVLLVMLRIPGTDLTDYQFTGVRRSAGNFLWGTRFPEQVTRPDLWIAFRNRDETAMSNSCHVTIETD